MNKTLQLFQALEPEVFTKKVIDGAPYFASIDPVLSELNTGHAIVDLKNQKSVRNHLGTVHAIAMCNAAELAAGMTTTVSIPDNARWIPTGMTVAYLGKAKTDLKVVAEASNVNFDVEGDVVVPVSAYDIDDKKVFEAKITMNVKLS